MDVIIQSQIQSNLTRTLQSIPTNASNYVHNIPDNTPPFSKKSVVVERYKGSADTLVGEQCFRIPKNGRLTRMYLKYRMIGHRNEGSNLTTMAYRDTCFAFANGIEKEELKSHNVVIQRIESSAIPFEAISNQSDEHVRMNVLNGMLGFVGSKDSVIFEPPRYEKSYVADNANSTGRDVEFYVMDFLVPLPFASTLFLKDNFQTRMMEDLELVVTTRLAPQQVIHPGPGVGKHDSQPLDKQDRHEISMVCEFMNFHEEVEAVIHAQNYKSGVPAVLLSSNHDKYTALYAGVEEDRPLDTAQFVTKLYKVDLPNDGLISNIYVVPYNFPDSQPYRKHFALVDSDVHFRLLSGSEVIMEGTRTAINGIESLPYSTVVPNLENEGTLPLRWSESGTNIRLGLNNTDSSLSGGVWFQSLVNPRMEIRVTTRNSAFTDFSLVLDVGDNERSNYIDAPGNVAFDVILKRKELLRIDGDTGMIQKSLES